MLTGTTTIEVVDEGFLGGTEVTGVAVVGEFTGPIIADEVGVFELDGLVVIGVAV